MIWWPWLPKQVPTYTRDGTGGPLASAGPSVSEIDQMLSLADELNNARVAYLNSFETSGRENTRAAWAQLMWDDKTTIIYGLRMLRRFRNGCGAK